MPFNFFLGLNFLLLSEQFAILTLTSFSGDVIWVKVSEQKETRNFPNTHKKSDKNHVVLRLHFGCDEQVLVVVTIFIQLFASMTSITEKKRRNCSMNSKAYGKKR